MLSTCNFSSDSISQFFHNYLVIGSDFIGEAILLIDSAIHVRDSKAFFSSRGPIVHKSRNGQCFVGKNRFPCQNKRREYASSLDTFDLSMIVGLYFLAFVQQARKSYSSGTVE